MSRFSRLYIISAVVLVLLSIAVGHGLGQSNSGFIISTDSEFNVPDRDITFEGDDYEITSISRAEEGNSLSVTGDGPAGSGYDIILYNADRQILDSRGTSAGKQSASIDLSYSPGTYTLAIDSQTGGTEVVHPVVIKGYDVSVSAAESVTSGDELNVDIELTERSSDTSLNYVEVVIANQSESVTKTASGSDGSYSVTVQTDGLSTGDYELYATVRGTEQVNGRDEVLGFSDRNNLQVTKDAGGDDGTDSSGGGGSGGTTGGSSTAVTDTETSPPTDAGTSSETVTAPETTVPPSPTPPRQTVPTKTAQPRRSTETTERSETTQPASSTESADAGRTVDITETTDGLILPSTPSPADDTAETPGGASSGFTLVITIVALLIAVGLRIARN